MSIKIKYPPQHVFPRNPYLADWFDPIPVKDIYNASLDKSIKFLPDVDGNFSIIDITSSPYIDFTKYNWDKNEWIEDYKPIELTILKNKTEQYAEAQPIYNKSKGRWEFPKDWDVDRMINFLVEKSKERNRELSGKETNKVKDRTNYFRNDIIFFPKRAVSLEDTILFYYNGKHIVTNYNFSSDEDKKRVVVKYHKMTDSIKMKCVLASNTPGVSLYTPEIDRYTLIVGKQNLGK